MSAFEPLQRLRAWIACAQEPAGAGRGGKAAQVGHGQSRPLILVTNDDGIDAPGLWDLVAAVDGLGDIAVVAPAREQSWAGRAHRSDPDPAAEGDLTL